MNDQELIAAFESGILAPGAFHHRDHVRLAWLYLQRHGRAEAERRLVSGLQAFAGRAGQPEKFDPELTRAWIARIETARVAAPHADFDALVSTRPDLLDRASVRLADVAGKL